MENVKTEVVSIASEEARTGQTINIPDKETLLRNASIEIIKIKTQLPNLMKTMSKKQIHRAVSAALDLPMEDQEVYLKTDEEKILFAYAQRAINARYLIMQDYIIKQMQAEKDKNNEIVV